jgi:serine/threonine protein kinase
MVAAVAAVPAGVSVSFLCLQAPHREYVRVHAMGKSAVCDHISAGFGTGCLCSTSAAGHLCAADYICCFRLCCAMPGATATAGSISHLAPEVLQHGKCTKAADLYSFGVLIFLVG